MTTDQEKAVQFHHRGCNCAQAVLLVFAERYGMDFTLAMRAGGGLGGGFRCGEMCGAVSGAVLAIGLKYAAVIPEDKEQKEICYQKTSEFIGAFRRRYGNVACRDLLKEKGRSICDELISGSVELMRILGY